MEDATGAWTVRLLHGAPPGIGEASDGITNGAQMSSLDNSSKYCVKYCELQHYAVLCRGG